MLKISVLVTALIAVACSQKSSQKQAPSEVDSENAVVEDKFGDSIRLVRNGGNIAFEADPRYAYEKKCVDFERNEVLEIKDKNSGKWYPLYESGPTANPNAFFIGSEIEVAFGDECASEATFKDLNGQNFAEPSDGLQYLGEKAVGDYYLLEEANQTLKDHFPNAKLLTATDKIPSFKARGFSEIRFALNIYDKTTKTWTKFTRSLETAQEKKPVGALPDGSPISAELAGNQIVISSPAGNTYNGCGVSPYELLRLKEKGTNEWIESVDPGAGDGGPIALYLDDIFTAEMSGWCDVYDEKELATLKIDILQKGVRKVGEKAIGEKNLERANEIERSWKAETLVPDYKSFEADSIKLVLPYRTSSSGKSQVFEKEFKLP